MDVTALNYLYADASAADPSITQERCRATLGALGLKGESALRRIGDLSGGEKAKVSFAAFVLKPVSLLLLDEPSNHIDVTALSALSEALVKFDGAMVVVSHDREFCRTIAPTHTVQVAGGKVDRARTCLYLTDSVFDRAVEAHEEAGSSGGGVQVDAAVDKTKRKLTYAEQKEKQKCTRWRITATSLQQKRNDRRSTRKSRN